MKSTSGRYESSLNKLKTAFMLTVALTVAVAVVAVVQVKERRALEKSIEELTQVKAGLERVRVANANRRQVLAAIRSQYDRSDRTGSAEMVLYRKYDELQSDLNPDEISAPGIERKGGEVSLPFVITFNNPDFNVLLNTANALHGNLSPLMPVSAVSIVQGEGRGAGSLICSITGKIVTSDRVKP